MWLVLLIYWYTAIARWLPDAVGRAVSQLPQPLLKSVLPQMIVFSCYNTVISIWESHTPSLECKLGPIPLELPCLKECAGVASPPPSPYSPSLFFFPLVLISFYEHWDKPENQV